MRERIQEVLFRYSDPRYLRWIPLLLALLALILGAAAPDGGGGTGGG